MQNESEVIYHGGGGGDGNVVVVVAMVEMVVIVMVGSGLQRRRMPLYPGRGGTRLSLCHGGMQRSLDWPPASHGSVGQSTLHLQRGKPIGGTHPTSAQVALGSAVKAAMPVSSSVS